MAALIESLRGIAGSVGGRAPARTPIPEPTPLTADPALAMGETEAQRRGTRGQEFITRQREELGQDDPANRNKWQKFFEWMGSVAASGDLSQAGSIMQELMRRDDTESREIRRMLAQLEMQGWTFEDLFADAQMRRASGEHTTSQQNVQMRDAWRANEAQSSNQYGLQSAQIASSAAARQADALREIAQLQYQLGEQQRQERLAALQGFAASPQYAPQAFSAMGAERFANPDTAEAMGGQLMAQAMAPGLQAYVSAWRGDKKDLHNFLRQWDPRLTEADLERADLIPRLLSSPNAAQAFRANPQLLYWANQQPPAGR